MAGVIYTGALELWLCPYGAVWSALPLDSADVVHVENTLKPTFAHR